MEHYFSAVDNDVYGSGNRFIITSSAASGIMSGPWSDLRLGLAWQTVMNDELPYHEPMRPMTLVGSLARGSKNSLRGMRSAAFLSQ